MNHTSFMAEYYDTAELDTFSALYGGQYLKPGTDPQLFSNEVSGENMKELAVTARNGCRMELYCETGEKTGNVEVPILNYKGYQVTDSTGKRYEVTTGANQVMKFDVSKNFSGKIQIQFMEPWYWKMGCWISAISFLCCSINFFIYRIREKNYDGKQ